MLALCPPQHTAQSFFFCPRQRGSSHAASPPNADRRWELVEAHLRRVTARALLSVCVCVCSFRSLLMFSSVLPRCRLTAAHASFGSMWVSVSAKLGLHIFSLEKWRPTGVGVLFVLICRWRRTGADVAFNWPSSWGAGGGV